MFRAGLPLFFENSWVPRFLSHFSPIDIGGITLGPFIFIKGTAGERLRIHESIHWEQYKELGIILFPILYTIFWLWNLIKLRDGRRAYFEIPFEVEAYENDGDVSYIFNRKKFAWARKREKKGPDLSV